jgi:DNA repair exonuclease SbcCD ATPase subunit
MSSEPFIVRLEIEGFRGFRDQAVFEFSGSAVVLAGPNGTGKTSFFDAVQWLFTGDLDRLLPYRARRNSEHVVNSYHSPEPARVTCWLNRAGDEMRATRSGNYESSTFEVSQGGVSSFGPDAESRLRSFVCASDDARIEVLLRNSGIMQQDVMRSVLEAHPATRHEYVSELLGLGALEGFQASVTDAAKALKDRSRVAKDELEAAEQSLARAKQSAQAVIDATAQDAAVEQAREALVSALREFPAKPSWRSHQPPSATVLIAELLRLRALLDRLGQSRESIDRREAMPGLDVLVASVRDREAVVEQLVEQLHAAETILAERTEVLESARSHSAAFDRLAALALEFLADDCPVCEQPIDPAAVAERLTLRSGESADLEAQRLAQIEAEATAGALRSQLAAAQAALNGDRQLLEERQGLERNWLELQRELVDIRDTAQYVSIEVVCSGKAAAKPRTECRRLSDIGSAACRDRLGAGAGGSRT